jgi:hypothetical protein
MNKKVKEVLNGLGMLVAAFAMMAVGVAFIFLVTALFHPHSQVHL